MPSAVIKYFNYDKEKEFLTVGFTSGSRYRYPSVLAGNCP